MATQMTLTEALERFRGFTRAQRVYYCTMNRTIYVYGWFILIYLAFFSAMIRYMTNEPSDVTTLSIIGAVTTTVTLYRYVAIRQQRENFEQRLGIYDHRYAIRRFSRKNL